MGRQVSFGRETTWGTPVTPTIRSEVVADSVQLKRTTTRKNATRSASALAIETVTEAVRGSYRIEGNYEDIGFHLKSFFGTVEAPVGPGPYTHEFPISTGIGSRLPFTMESERGSADRTFEFNGCKVNSLTIRASLSESPTFEFGVLGKAETYPGAVTSLSPLAFNPILLSDLALSFDGGSTAQDVQSVEIVCDWPLSEDFKLGSDHSLAREPEDAGYLTVRGTAVCVISNTTNYQAIYDGSTVVDVQLAFSDGTQSLTLNMNKCAFDDATVPMEGLDSVLATYQWESYFDATDTDALHALLVNNQATV